MIVEPQKPILLLNTKIPCIKPDWYLGVSSRDLLAIPRVQLKTKYTFFPKHENATSTKHKLQTQKNQIPNTLLAKLITLLEL